MWRADGRAVRAGSRVVCVTATRGEQGSADEQRWPPGPSLAAVRTREMEQALAALGVTEHHWLDYADGHCAEVPGAEAAPQALLAYATNTPQWLERFRPGLDSAGVFMGAEPPSTPVDELVIHGTFDGELLAAKLAAIRSQVSQVEPLIAALGEDFLRDGMTEESFRRP